MPDKLVRGTQVVYVPSHLRQQFDAMQAKGVTMTYDYPNGVQPGFVSSGPMRSVTYGPLDTYFVRYWLVKNGYPICELRTKSNSERTYTRDLVVLDVVPQEWVVSALEAESNWYPGKEV